ncbi:MAG: S8 family serine peptidase, partial [Armatimonadota bacterium]|nr:S8 family serine peptidase [Armatimonadota bacterium]
MQKSREWLQAKMTVGLAVCALANAFCTVPASAHPMGIPGVDFDSRQVYVIFKPGTSDAAIQMFAAAYATGPLKPAQYFFAPHDIRSAFILTLKPGLNPADIADAVGMTQLHSPTERASHLATHRMAVQGRATSLMGRLTASPILDMISPRFFTHCLQTTTTPITGTGSSFAAGTFGPTATPITSFAFPAPAAIPNDPLFPQQWALDSNHVEALTAWAISPAAGSGIPVAVLDTGYDLTHEDLQTNIDIAHSRSWTNPATDPNYFNITPEHQFNVETAKVSLDFDHGTSVSGIISATHNNGLGISGLAYNSTLWFEKVEAQFSAGDTSNNLDNNAIALAFQYVADRGVRVVNISL